MKILLDECIAYSIYRFLQKEKYEVSHVKEMNLSGNTNGEVYQKAKENFQIFITSDRHFRNTNRFTPTKELGVILLRVNPSLPQEQLKAIKKFLETTSLSNCIGKLSIIHRYSS